MTLVKAKEDNPNPLFGKQEISRPLISEKAPLKGVELKDSYLYDVLKRDKLIFSLNYNRCINMKKIVFSLLMLVPFGLVSCFSGASESSTEEIET